MPDPRERVLEHLKSLQIETQTIDHAAAMTVDDLAKFMPQCAGSLTKNLLLKEKKGRVILVTAMAETTIDLKVLSQRLGLGKNGLRMAPEQLIPQILQVPLGSVTPFALLHDTAKPVVLLLDRAMQSKARLCFHPLTNEASTLISPAGLDAFLKSIGRTPDYVDLEVAPVVNKDSPPDLAEHLQGAEAIDDPTSAPSPNPETTAAPMKAPGKQQSKAPPAADNVSPIPGDDVQVIMERVLSLCLNAAKEEVSRPGFSSEHAAVEGAFGATVRSQVAADMLHALTMFKNAAYTSGFSAARAVARKAL
eukprot:jgi/Chlat1/9097/Chrsp97S08373